MHSDIISATTDRLRRYLIALACVGVLACGDSGTDVGSVTVTIEPLAGLAVGVGGRYDFLAVATDESGSLVTLAVREITWSIASSAIATIDQNGLATGVSAGVTTVTASVGGASGTAQLEVYVPDLTSSFEVGTSYFGRNEYIEYIPGDLPLILSAPHGGALQPAEAADRTFGVTGADRNTAELTLAVREALIEQTGYAPHVIISHLHRSKLDPNREIVEAAQDDPFAENAWHEFQNSITSARAIAEGDFGGGLYFDMHGHGHSVPRVELGYLLSSARLNGPDDELNNLTTVQLTSIRELGRVRPSTFAELLRGETSLGGFLADEGVESVPSPASPGPGTDAYFTGGYNTRQHGSRADSELVSGIQLEHQFPGLRDTDAHRREYADQLARAVRLYMLEHFGYFEPQG
jgi:hypothetical protein